MLSLSKKIYNEMLECAQAAYPDEACGILAGKNSKTESFIPLRNADASPVSYEADSAEQFRAFRQIENDGRVLTGIFHSHPSSEAIPSSKDRALALYPDVSYLILSLARKAEPVLKSYRLIAEGQMTPEDVKIV